MRNIETNGFIRVSKPRARKEYEAGKQIIICPWKVNPENVWGMRCTLLKDADCTDFDSMVNAYTCYNCHYRELGYYPAFYIREGK